MKARMLVKGDSFNWVSCWCPLEALTSETAVFGGAVPPMNTLSRIAVGGLSLGKANRKSNS